MCHATPACLARLCTVNLWRVVLVSNKSSNIVWRSMGVPEALHAEIGEIARAEDRSRHVVVKRAIAAYRQQSAGSESALK